MGHAASIAEIESYFHEMMAHYDLPAGILSVVGGSEDFVLPFGPRCLGEAPLVDEQTAFSVASCSKAFTATACGILVDEGRLSFDDPVKKYLPELELDERWITEHVTLRDLLGMRLGLGQEGVCHWGRNRDIPHDVVFRRMKYMPRVAEFRTAFTYLNPAYTAAAEIVTRISGEPFGEFLSERILSPLGMRDTVMSEVAIDPDLNFARPNIRVKGKAQPLPQPRCGGREGESCMFVSGRDVLKWMRANLNWGMSSGTRIISEATLAEIFSPQIIAPRTVALEQRFASYCMGWSGLEYQGRYQLMHEGGEFGASTLTMLSPEDDIGIAIYLPMTAPEAVRSILFGTFDRLVGGWKKDWTIDFKKMFEERQADMAKMISAKLEASQFLKLDDLSACSGEYQSPHSGMVVLRSEGEGLLARFGDGEVYNCQLSLKSDGGVEVASFDYPAMGAQLPSTPIIGFSGEQKNISSVEFPGLGKFTKLN